MNLYVYELSSLEHIATIVCEIKDDCETQAIAMFGLDNEYAWTFYPRFGKTDGLKHDPDAAILDYRIGK
jgi:hypothetical protein